MSRLTRPATVRSVDLGGVTATYVPDGVVKMRPGNLFLGVSDFDPGHLDSDGCLTISSGGLLVRAGDRAMLIDAGYGPHPEPVAMEEYGIIAMYGGALSDNLDALGVPLDTVESIAVTHLHMEHVGWISSANAPVLLSAQEWSGRDTAPGMTPDVLDAIARDVRTVSEGELVFPGVRVTAFPGHTAGQLGFTVTGRDLRLIAFADALHSPLQVQHPDWTVLGEPDPELSRGIRRRLIEQLTDTHDTVGFGIHFADVPFGTVREGRWVAYDQDAPSGRR